MKSIAVAVSVCILLTACGGGGDQVPSNASALSVVYDDLTPQVGSSATQASASVCGYQVGAQLLQGTVVNVYDGDTLTLSAAGVSYKVRLDGIDAPELAQGYGGLSSSSLSSAVLGKTVKVAYNKTDRYGRVVGAVFTDACEYVNLSQVAAGAAWFYKAYQCELSATTRALFVQAQQTAVDGKLGLWTGVDPEAPWFYRNGVEPVTPTCALSAPSWPGNVVAPVAVTSGGSSTGGGSSSSTPICYVGPRGGTYTITKNGNKNYSGC